MQLSIATGASELWASSTAMQAPSSQHAVWAWHVQNANAHAESCARSPCSHRRDCIMGPAARASRANRRRAAAAAAHHAAAADMRLLRQHRAPLELLAPSAPNALNRRSMSLRRCNGPQAPRLPPTAAQGACAPPPPFRVHSKSSRVRGMVERVG